MTAQPLFWWQDADAIPDEAMETPNTGEASTGRDAFERDLDRAAAEIEAANLRYEEAVRRLRCAPHGEVSSRRQDLRLANTQILRAEVRYAELKRQEPAWD